MSFPFPVWKENRIADPEAFSCPVSSAKPRAMNRTGLFIALALAAVIELLFGIHPELDLKLAALFYDPASKSFPLKFKALAEIARDAAMWISWGLAVPAIIAVLVKLARPDRPLRCHGEYERDKRPGSWQNQVSLSYN